MKILLNNRLIRFLIGLTTTLLSLAILYNDPLVHSMMEARLLDLRFRVRGAVPPPDSVVIAVIDEKSLARLGRWPWDRTVMARLVDKLAEAEAAVIGFDVIFPEAESGDQRFAAAIKKAGNVIMPMAFDLHKKGTPLPDSVLERSAIVSVEEPERFKSFPPIMSSGVLTLPQQQLKESARSLAHINMLPDEFDGTLRWEGLLLGYDNSLFASLGLRSAAFFLGIPDDRLTVVATRGVRLGKTFIPTDSWGRMPINYYGPAETFRYFSISDILDGTVGEKELGNRIVFIGATALGIFDLRVTPFSAAMPGVEKHAAVAASILQNRFIRKADVKQDILFLAISGLLLALILSRLRVVWGAIAMLGAVTIVTVTGYLLFSSKGIWINLTCPIGNALLMFMTVTAWNYAFEERYARRIRAMFSSYVTQTIVNELIRNPEMAHLGGEQREITVLFSDVVGFTTFSEQHTPQEVVAILNEYLGAMTDVILKWEGILDKFIGDAIVVFWGAPMKQEDHAERAVRCALEMQERLEQLRRKWEAEGRTPLSSGIGLNTGEAIVGNIGAEGKKMDYTVIGDHVNLGARVEGLTRRYDARILMTEYTLAKLQPSIDAGLFRGVSILGQERVIVKGKDTPVGIYAVSLLEPEAETVVVACDPENVVRLTEK
jgi:adenylate cyclase